MNHDVTERHHSLLRQFFSSSAGQFVKLCGSPRQIFHV